MKSHAKTTIDRLLEFMYYKGLNDNKITIQAGLSVGLIGRARRNKSGLHTDTIEKILVTFPELNPTWLLTGNETMLLKPEQELSQPVHEEEIDDSLIGEIFSTQREVISLLKRKYFKTTI